MRVALDSSLLPRLFDSGYLDSVLEHELQHLGVIPSSEICRLAAPDVLYDEKVADAHVELGRLLTEILWNVVSDVFAISRMSEPGQKKYLQFEYLKLELEWKQSTKVTSEEYLKAPLILRLAELELMATKMSCSLPSRFASMKAIATPNADDEAFYDETLTLCDLIWEQAKRESPVLADKAATRRLRQILRTQKEPFIPRSQGAWESLKEIT